MKFRPLVRLATRASLVALAIASVAVGCSRQGEGERCDAVAAGDDDCDSGLVCVTCAKLAQHQTDRCCPPGGSSDPRCQLSTVDDDALCRVANGTGGTVGSAGSGSSGAGAGGMSSGGAGTAGSSSGGTAGEDEPAGAGGA